MSRVRFQLRGISDGTNDDLSMDTSLIIFESVTFLAFCV